MGKDKTQMSLKAKTYNVKADYLKESWIVIHVGEKIFQEKGINCQWHDEADKILGKKINKL